MSVNEVVEKTLRLLGDVEEINQEKEGVLGS